MKRGKRGWGTADRRGGGKGGGGGEGRGGGIGEATKKSGIL